MMTQISEEYQEFTLNITKRLIITDDNILYLIKNIHQLILND